MHEIEFPTFQFKMVSDFSAFLRYQIGDRQNKRMFGGVFVAGFQIEEGFTNVAHASSLYQLFRHCYRDN